MLVCLRESALGEHNSLMTQTHDTKISYILALDGETTDCGPYFHAAQMALEGKYPGANRGGHITADGACIKIAALDSAFPQLIGRREADGSARAIGRIDYRKVTVLTLPAKPAEQWDAARVANAVRVEEGEPLKTYKTVGWSYSTSENAARFHLPGCWTFEEVRPTASGKCFVTVAMSGHTEFEQAVEAARKSPLPWLPSFLRNNLDIA